MRAQRFHVYTCVVCASVPCVACSPCLRGCVYARMRVSCICVFACLRVYVYACLVCVFVLFCVHGGLRCVLVGAGSTYCIECCIYFRKC